MILMRILIIMNNVQEWAINYVVSLIDSAEIF